MPCTDVPITAWVNKSVLAISRSFVFFYEREIIFDITTVTAVATRLAILYTARMAATKSFTAFTQFEAVTHGQAMYEQNCKDFNRLRYKQHSTIAMLLTSWSFSRAKPYGKKHKLLRSGWPAAAPTQTSCTMFWIFGSKERA